MKFHEFAWTALVAGLAVSMSVAPAVAKSGSSKAKVKPTISAAGKTAPKATTGAKAKPQAPKAKTAGPAATKKSSATATKGNNKTKPTDAKPTLSSEPVPSTIPLSKAQQLLAKNTNLRMKLQSRLPRGTDVMAAAAGFRSLGQFVAAVNVSNNLGLNFFQLKRAMTGEQQMSLGQAIQFVKGLDATTATTTANTALSLADVEITTSSTTVTTTKKGKGKS